MKSRRSLIVISGVLLFLLVAVATTLYAVPTVARYVAMARLQAITNRPVTIDADRLEDGLHQRGIALEAVLVGALERVVVIEEVLLLGVKFREEAVESQLGHETRPLPNRIEPHM
jgi:hypothetical protein